MYARQVDELFFYGLESLFPFLIILFSHLHISILLMYHSIYAYVKTYIFIWNFGKIYHQEEIVWNKVMSIY